MDGIATWLGEAFLCVLPLSQAHVPSPYVWPSSGRIANCPTGAYDFGCQCGTVRDQVAGDGNTSGPALLPGFVANVAPLGFSANDKKCTLL